MMTVGTRLGELSGSVAIMTPAKPVEMALSYRKDNDNPVLAVFRREVSEAFGK